jgi:hypothetical protein
MENSNIETLTKDEYLVLNKQLADTNDMLREQILKLKSRIHNNDLTYQKHITYYKAEYKNVCAHFQTIYGEQYSYGIDIGQKIYVFTLTPTETGGLQLRAHFGQLSKETPTHLTIIITNKHNNNKYRYVLRKTEITAIKTLYDNELVKVYDRPITKDEVAITTLHESCYKADRAIHHELKELKEASNEPQE